MKKTLSFLFFVVLFANSVAQPTMSNHSTKRIIFKVKSASPLLEALRQTAPRSLGKMTHLPGMTNVSPHLTRFLQKVRLNSFKAVKPDATTAPLAAGIERIFVAEIADNVSVEAVIE